MFNSLVLAKCIQLLQLQVNTFTSGCCSQVSMVPSVFKISGLLMGLSMLLLDKHALPLDCLRMMVNGIIALKKQQTFKLDGPSNNSSLPSFFTAILLHCHPTHPEALWTEFCAHICDDLARELIQKGLHQAPTPEEVYDYGLYLIEGLITQAGRAMARVCPSMPTSQIIWSQVIGNPLIAQHTCYNCDLLQQEVHDMLPLLNNEQQIGYDGVVMAFRSGRGGVFFIHGAGGTDKTFLYNLIAKAICSNGQIVFCSASSGVAGILLHDVPLLIPPSKFQSSSMRVLLARLNSILHWVISLLLRMCYASGMRHP